MTERGTAVERNRGGFRAWALLLALVTACDSERTIRDGPLQLPGSVWTTVQTSEFKVSGPDGELCLDVDGKVYDTAPSPGVLTVAQGGSVTIDGRLAADSAPIFFAAPYSLDAGRKKSLCFEQSPAMGNRTFRSVQIRPTAPLTVQRITWWSGKRRPLS